MKFTVSHHGCKFVGSYDDIYYRANKLADLMAEIRYFHPLCRFCWA